MRPELAAIQARRDRELRSELAADRGGPRALAGSEDPATGWCYLERGASSC